MGDWRTVRRWQGLERRRQRWELAIIEAQGNGQGYQGCTKGFLIDFFVKSMQGVNIWIHFRTRVVKPDA